jgi:hypothetical protein
MQHHEHVSNLERLKNYIFGGAGMAISLADITGVFQCIAAIGGAILVLRQLYRDWKKNG